MKIFLIIIIAALIIGAYFTLDNRHNFSGEGTGNTEVYSNERFSFSFEEPQGYSFRELEDGSQYIVLTETEDVLAGFQILITKLDGEDFQITKEIILSEIPGIMVDKEEEIAVDGVKGLLFESDNPAFGGASIEAWFTHKGNLYQISGYRGALLAIKETLSTWAFK